jgi:hypothetical protein
MDAYLGWILWRVISASSFQIPSVLKFFNKPWNTYIVLKFNKMHICEYCIQLRD